MYANQGNYIYFQDPGRRFFASYDTPISSTGPIALMLRRVSGQCGCAVRTASDKGDKARFCRVSYNTIVTW
jgi:hypothetical protein